MQGRSAILLRLMLLVCLIGARPTDGQILRDTTSVNLISECVDDVYSFRFDEARKISVQIREIFPGHPVVNLLNGMIIYWENYPLIPSSPNHFAFELEMLTCIKLCENPHDLSDHPEYLLTSLGARGLLLSYYADNKLTREVSSLARSTYRYVRQSFDYTSVYSDFHFFTGLYNYYREAYPEAHPAYKMVAFLFPKGDRWGGLRDLKVAATNSIMLKAESSSFLSDIYLNYEKDYEMAYSYCKSLFYIYPSNNQYLSLYIRILLLTKRYDEAESLIRLSGERSGTSYFKAQLEMLDGILQEKKYGNYAEAQKLYKDGLDRISAYGRLGDEYASLAYFGLSRIGDEHKRRVLHKKAMDLTDYKRDLFADN